MVKTYVHTLLILIFVIESSLVVGFSLFFLYTDTLLKDRQLTSSIMMSSATTTPLETAEPMLIRIPTINLEAHIQSVGLDPKNENEMGVPTNFTDVGWYNRGPRPGMSGSAVIAGHYSGKHLPQAVFYHLDTLVLGDIVEVIDAEGTTLQYSVVKVASYAHNAPTEEIFSLDGEKSRLNLITCAGDWIKSDAIYDRRTVVFTELVGTSKSE